MADIDAVRIYTVVREHLSDVEEFLKFVKELMENPGRLGLEVA